MDAFPSIPPTSRAQQTFEADGQVIVGFDRFWLPFLITAGIGSLGAGLFFYLRGNPFGARDYWIMIAVMVGFGIFMLVFAAIWHFGSRSPLLVISPEGLEIPGAGVRRIPWNEVHHATAHQSFIGRSNTMMLGVSLVEGSDANTMPRSMRFVGLLASIASISNHDITIPFNHMNYSVDEIAGEINRQVTRFEWASRTQEPLS